MKQKHLTSALWLFMLIISVANKSEANINERSNNVYIGLQTGGAFSKIKSVTYQNPRLNNFNPIFASDKSTRVFYSMLLGIKPSSSRIRIEVELMHKVNTTFNRSYDVNLGFIPVIGHNKIMIKSLTNLVNFHLDFNHFKTLMINFNLGAGTTKRKAFAEQSAPFMNLESVFGCGSKTRFTAAIGAGISKQFERFDLTVGYRYINKGYFKTGLIAQTRDEDFSGKISGHNIQFSIRSWIC